MELSVTMQHFISQIAAGHTEMASLINWDGVQTRQQIRQSEIGMKDLINACYVEDDLKMKRNRLLQGLKFESMNARRTDIKIASEATYASFFKSLEFEKEPTSGSAAAAWADFVGWLQSDEQTFWIQGKPGAGKSTLVKFLLQHENTPKALDKWGFSPLIVSHFFWKPGGILQRNFRGLLCSLNHQLLSDEPSLVDQILSEFVSTKENDSIVDWEISHLMDIFKFTMTHYKRSIFFLIDGVDEAVDTEEILNFLTSSITLRNTKWCISSRGEEIFQQAFSKCKGFKLNEYTKDDMLSFAWKEIHYVLANVQGYETMYTELFLKELQRTLVDKAEGVYIWLALALESVKRGFRHSDHKDVILSRLRKLPVGLEELYADMWDRLGEDKDIYQREAAHYFNLLITHRTLVEEYNGTYNKKGNLFECPLTPFQIYLAKDDKSHGDLLNESSEPQLSKLEKKCSDLMKVISIETAGILTTQENPKTLWSGLQVRAEYSQLEKHATSKIDFVHRTLFDFLRDTKIGNKILSHAQANLVYVQLATTMLCQLRIMEIADESLFTRNRLLHPRGGSLHFFRWVLNQAQRSDNERLLNTLLPAYETLFKAGLIPWDKRPKGCPKPCFDVLLLDDPAFDPFIKQRLKSKGASYASCVLREYMFVGNAEFSQYNNPGVGILEFLHDLGADINSAGACFYEPPGRVELNGQLTTCFTYDSALSTMIKGLFNFSYYTLPHKLLYLVAFLKRSPNLDMHTSCILPTSNEPKTWDWNWNVSLLMSAITFPKEAASVSWQRANYLDFLSRDRRGHNVVIITEVNLKYLVELFLKSHSSNDTTINALIVHAQQLAKLEGSKAYCKACFILFMKPRIFKSQDPFKPAFDFQACFRFVDKDIDVFQKHLDSIAEFPMKVFPYSSLIIRKKEVLEYLRHCIKVSDPTLLILLYQKLGACFHDPMNYS